MNNTVCWGLCQPLHTLFHLMLTTSKDGTDSSVFKDEDI